MLCRAALLAIMALWEGDVSEVQVLESGIQIVVFELAGELFGVDIFRVQEIIRNRDVTPVPKAPDHVKGLINLRGQTIPIVDLSWRLGLGPNTPSDATRIIVVDACDGHVGLLVDAVTEVLTVPKEMIEEAPKLATGDSSSHVLAIARKERSLISLLDVDRALATSSS
ncbi:MAG: purine-binding chemotaxis protein CheW [Fimbriimonadia bacterium]